MQCILLNKYILYIASLLLPLTLLAQTDCTADSLAQQLRIDEVTVTAKRRAEPVVPAQILEGDRLQALSTYSVADAVRYFSGVQLKDYGGVGGLKTVDLRSMGTHHLGVFYDGIEIGNAQNGVVDLCKFSMDNIERVSLYNGQKAEIFQSAKDFGSAGTLYLRTRRPRFEPGKNFNLMLTMKAGTFGLANPSVLYEQRITDNIHFSANAEYQYAHGRYHFRYRRVMPDRTVAWDTTAVRQNGDVNAWRAEAGFFGYMPQGKWHVKGYFYQSEKGIPGAIVNNVWTNAQRQWDRNAFVQASYMQTLAPGYDIKAAAKYSNDRLRYLNPDTTLLYIDNTFLQQEIYITLANRLHLAGRNAILSGMRNSQAAWDFNLSVDWQWNTLDADLKNFVFPTRNTLMFAAATAVDWKWLRAQASILGTYVHDRLRYPSATTKAGTENRLEWSPAVFLSYQPYLPEELYLRAFWKRNLRMPTFNDLYYTDVGNIALQPEQCTQYDGGAEYTRTWQKGVMRQVRLRADGYFNQIHNKIVAIPKGNGQYRWMMMNLGYVEIRGVDVNAGLTLCPINEWLISANLTYTYQRAQDFTNPDEITYGGQIAYIPWHSGSVAASTSWRGLTLNYSFIYVGERYHNSANIPQNYEQPWYTHDLSVSYDWQLPATKNNLSPRLHFAVEINNMLNQQYEVILNYPMPGINGKGIVKLML
ncbi:MAG: TonB-dependent receptor plug domain-containing protein [Paludibacteraceae bacterium]|nr:TonB-dependent receptor plug domain-containing protein [Paludibacteraceae bacterium]